MPVNAIAPFEFSENVAGITFYNSNEFSLEKLNLLYDDVKPELIYCAGWNNEIYIKFCKSKSRNSKTLLGFDNPWIGTIRQHIGSFVFSINTTPYFNYVFIPGLRQIKFALKMGFKESQIITGAYSADVDFFKFDGKEEVISKVFVFAGRYVKEKGIDLLCESFIELKSSGLLSDWKLYCIGKGTYQIPKHSDIIDYGFRQPNELKEIIKSGGVFVLPSSFEPWGVVVHEFAASGFPLLCSDAVGAADVFLLNGKNGYIFKHNNKQDLKLKMLMFSKLSLSELKLMQNESRLKAFQLTPQKWASKIYSLI
ncbi:MAG: glycosyltransferase [Bacteroidota bacterium]|jgi:glycosyltransferase involved in cell wall biosynthesis